MNAIETWVVAHQAFLLIVWPSLTALASLVYKLLDETTRGHAFFASLAALGIDLPRLWEKLSQLFTGSSGTGGASSGSSGPDARTEPPAPPRANRFSMARLFGFALAGLLVLTGCANFHPNVPPNAPADVQGATDCVLQALMSNGDVGQCIVTYGPALIADALQTLLDSTQFQEQHPELVPVVKDRLLSARRAQARGAVQ